MANFFIVFILPHKSFSTKNWTEKSSWTNPLQEPVSRSNRLSLSSFSKDELYWILWGTLLNFNIKHLNLKQDIVNYPIIFLLVWHTNKQKQNLFILNLKLQSRKYSRIYTSSNYTFFPLKRGIRMLLSSDVWLVFLFSTVPSQIL